MRLTNRLNLPDAIVQAVKNDGYSRGDSDISVTQLIAPPRKVSLERVHADDIEEDVSDRVWSLLGQSVHTILERANSTGIAERRLTITVDGWRISGGMDAYYEKDGLLHDYKLSSVWSFMGELKPEFENQQNCYAEILRQNGHDIKRLEIIGILRDWTKSKAKLDPEYPQAQVITVPVPLWHPIKAQGYLAERVRLHKAARHLLPNCTPEEQWARPDKWAVMKPGGKRSIKNYDTEAGAREHASMDSTLSVENRPGELVRCRDYCGVSKWCDQYQDTLRS
jgi:hypothetical protein